MRTVSRRHGGVTFGVLIGGFVAGPLMGLRLGETMAPDSEIAQIASVFAFALAYLGGMTLWLGIGVVRAAVEFAVSLLRGTRPTGATLTTGEALLPPGYGAFPVLSLALAGVAGLLVGLLSSTSLVTALGAYGLAGAVYGGSLWWLARTGYLPFPEPAC